ncbi:hypothetical protein ZWY2020_008500 [Hordeum vulgare]|nr:hypothetical protein ZWY2020_008500 [Hordeum vulgare]
MRVKVQEYNTCVVVDIEYNHNHHLIQSANMLVFLYSYKNYDPTLLEYVKLLQYHDVKHTTIMKAMNARKDDLDDVIKLMYFFKDLKAINDEFFYDIQVDSDGARKNISWSNASFGAYQDIADYEYSTQLTKQTYSICL